MTTIFHIETTHANRTSRSKVTYYQTPDPSDLQVFPECPKGPQAKVVL